MIKSGRNIILNLILNLLLLRFENCTSLTSLVYVFKIQFKTFFIWLISYKLLLVMIQEADLNASNTRIL